MDDIYIIKPNELENYAKELSSHDFFELFPSEKYTFDQNKYAYYLYLDQIELEKYLADYMTFFARTNIGSTFDTEKYFDTWGEFCKYMERENVYVHYKTKLGAFYLNRAVDTMLYLKRDGYLDTNGKPNKFTQKYFYPFFSYAENKLTGSATSDDFSIEKLEPEDLMYFQEIYMGKVKPQNSPFFLDEQNKSYKHARSFVVTNILPMTPSEQAYLLISHGKVIGLALANAIKSNSVTLTIITDNDYMDSDFATFLNMFKSLYSDKVSKITIKNQNRGIASSNLNSACILAHFKPDYDNFSLVDGYTQYDSIFKYNDEEDINPLTRPSTPHFADFN